MLDYLRSRAISVGAAGIRERVRAAAPDAAETAPVTVRTIVLVTRALPDGGTGPQIFVAELGWKEYAILQRLHLLDHRTQIKKLRAALAPAG